jgi:hypothetical protein
MEGLAALGVAANVAQFIEYGLKLIEKGRKLRDTGAIEPDLNDEARKLRHFVTKLNSQSSQQSGEDLRQLAAECAQVSGELISELEKLRPKDDKSVLQHFKAIVKGERKKDHINELERRLGSCRTRLGLQLNDLSR